MKVVRLKPVHLPIFVLVIVCSYVLFCIIFLFFFVFVLFFLFLFCFVLSFFGGRGGAEERNHSLDKDSTPQTSFQPAV